MTRSERIALIVSAAIYLAVMSTYLIVHAQTSDTAATAPSATAASNALRQVHSPGLVSEDLQLSPGTCHVRVIDAANGIYLPDPSCTPGAIDPAVTQANIGSTICKSGYTATVRPPTSNTGVEKNLSLAEYGQDYSKTTEYDHLVPLELGGANSISNLFPEPNTSTAKSVENPKDAVEGALNAAVCNGTVTLAAAQQAIATNWATAETQLGIQKLIPPV